MFCIYCGKEISKDSVFCPSCGKKLMEPGTEWDDPAEIDRYDTAETAEIDQYDVAKPTGSDKYETAEQTETDQYGTAGQAEGDWKENLLKGKLKCPDCGYGNLLEASYCYSCGREFTEKEQQDAYNLTIYGKIEKAEMIKSIADGSIITGSIWFRVIVIAVIAAVGLWGLYKNGSNFRIAESDRYEVQYNTEEKEYYLFTDYDSINVALYVPRDTEELELTAVNTFTDEVLEQKTYSVEEGIALYPDSNVKYVVSTGKRELTLYALRK